MSNVTITPAQLRIWLERWTRERADLPPSAAVFIHDRDMLIGGEGWGVTWDDGDETRTAHLGLSGLVTLPDLDDVYCAECGEKRGETAHYAFDDYQVFDRGRELVQRGGWTGCDSCIEVAMVRAEMEQERLENAREDEDDLRIEWALEQREVGR
jgi:hypothetical protein